MGGTEYSFTVALVDTIGPYCGGSLVAKYVVLTAAHCFGALSDVAVNRHDLRNEGEGEVIPMARQLQHPRYKKKTTNNDFMLVFLERPITEDVRLATLNDSASYPHLHDRATVVGWGDTDPSDEVDVISDELLEVDVHVIANDVCEASSHGNENYHGKITEEMLCAANPLKDSCQGECPRDARIAASMPCLTTTCHPGDSGGPLLLPKGRGLVQIGVVSVSSLLVSLRLLPWAGSHPAPSAVPVGHRLRKRALSGGTYKQPNASCLGIPNSNVCFTL